MTTGWYRYQHVNVIRHQMSFLDPALLPSRQVISSRIVGALLAGPSMRFYRF
jgi:hypothetical protein